MESGKIFLIGLNHLTAPVSCRERTAIKPEDAEGLLKLLKEQAGLIEAVILSTCSRVEIIAASGDVPRARLILQAWFLGRAGVNAEDALYFKQGEAAVAHVFRVACGLDSWIIGESEILAQIKRAYLFSLERRQTGRLLNRVFQMAIAAGKAVRAQTGIQNGIHSIGGAAALLARRIFNAPASGSVLVVGAGEAATAVARHLAAKNFSRLIVANRTVERAQVVAGALGGTAVGFREGLEKLAEVEIAVFSANCSEVLLNAPQLKALAAKRGKPLFLIDLGMPRNIDPACARIDGVYVYNLDDLKGVVAESMGAKAEEKVRAEEQALSLVKDCLIELEKKAARVEPSVAGTREAAA